MACVCDVFACACAWLRAGECDEEFRILIDSSICYDDTLCTQQHITSTFLAVFSVQITKLPSLHTPKHTIKCSEHWRIRNSCFYSVQSDIFSLKINAHFHHFTIKYVRFDECGDSVHMAQLHRAHKVTLYENQLLSFNGCTFTALYAAVVCAVRLSSNKVFNEPMRFMRFIRQYLTSYILLNNCY